MTDADAYTTSLRSRIAKITGHEFTDMQCLKNAFRHKSVTGKNNYERLEFFGDRVLGLVVSATLYHQFPDADQGELTARFHALTHEGYLASIADSCQLAQFIEYHGADDIPLKPSVQSDIVESLIAALYLDGGVEAARAFILSHWTFDQVMPNSLEQNPKSALQEWAAAHKRGLPEYRLVEKSGSEHQPEFTVSVGLKGFEDVFAQGTSIKSAERKAARQLLEHIQKNN